MTKGMTHEDFIQKVRSAAVQRALELGTITEDEASRLLAAKLVYGAGDGRYRGVCHYSAWKSGESDVEVIEIAASAEEGPVQVAGTTVHELGHALAGWGEGHGKGWKDSCQRLGLRRALAAGQRYTLALLEPGLRGWVVALIQDLTDGSPKFVTGLSPIRIVAPMPCPMGRGTKGGKSRGPGSGSRLRLWVCGCETPVKVRVASDEFRAHCDLCGEAFALAVANKEVAAA